MVPSQVLRVRAVISQKGVTLLELLVVIVLLMVVSGGVFAGVQRANHRMLNNVSLQLQADIRYAQRRALIEGRRFSVIFDQNAGSHGYRIRNTAGQTIRTETLPGGVTFSAIDHRSRFIEFTAQGTPNPGGYAIVLQQGTNKQCLTVTISGGRVQIFPINVCHHD
jgi:prepilin-type N-terminal cleavage/methylation domain-containing protein